MKKIEIMTEQEIKEKALEAYPVKHMDAPGWNCIDENAVKRTAYAEGLAAANTQSLREQLRAAKDRCEAVITEAVRQYKKETGLSITKFEGVIDDNGEILRVGCNFNWTAI